MKFKLDENLGLAPARILSEAGHDVWTVHDQRLNGASDDVLIDACRREQRCLVTLDLDFGNVFRFPPEATAGIVVLRPPGRTLVDVIATLTAQLVSLLGKADIAGQLWIVELGRVRIHQSTDPND